VDCGLLRLDFLLLAGGDVTRGDDVRHNVFIEVLHHPLLVVRVCMEEEGRGKRSEDRRDMTEEPRDQRERT